VAQPDMHIIPGRVLSAWLLEVSMAHGSRGGLATARRGPARGTRGSSASLKLSTDVPVTPAATDGGRTF